MINPYKVNQIIKSSGQASIGNWVSGSFKEELKLNMWHIASSLAAYHANAWSCYCNIRRKKATRLCMVKSSTCNFLGPNVGS